MFDHDGLRWWVVRRPGIAVSLTAAIVAADAAGRIPASVATIRDRDGQYLIPDCVTVHRPGQDQSCPALPSGCSMDSEREPGAPEARLLRAYEADGCQPHSIADGLVEILHREVGEAEPTPPPERHCIYCGARDNLTMRINPMGLVYKTWECSGDGCPVPPLDLAELERLLAAADPAPWQADSAGAVWPVRVMGDPVSVSSAPEHAALIAALRNWAPELIRLARALINAGAALDADASVLPERAWNPGAPPVLPPLPASAYPAGATPLEPACPGDPHCRAGHRCDYHRSASQAADEVPPPGAVAVPRWPAPRPRSSRTCVDPGDGEHDHAMCEDVVAEATEVPPNAGSAT